MEAAKDHTACPVATAGSKLRYPLRSASKQKDGRPAVPDASVTSSSKRLSARKSVDVLNLSAKEKFAKRSERNLNLSKTTVSPRPAPFGSITPISETQMQRANARGRTNSPLSEISSTCKRKFNVLTSVSYWLTQIKLAESASKHAISLGFFKLALDSGCEPLQRMREELKSYAHRHNLISELTEATQELLQLYNILEDFQQLKISQTGSPMEEGEHTLNEDAHRTLTGDENLKPRSLISETRSVAESNKKERAQKWLPAAKNAASNTKNLGHAEPVKDTNGNNVRKKSQKPSRAVSKSGGGKVKSSTKKSSDEKVDPLPVVEVSQEDKENIDALSMGEGNIKAEIETS